MTYPQPPEWSTASPPPGDPSAPPPPGRRRLLVPAVAIVGVVALIVVVIAVALGRDTSGTPAFPASGQGLDTPIAPLPSGTFADPSGGPVDPALPYGPGNSPAPAPATAPPTPITDPVAATRAYYGALAAHHTATAFALLCSARQQAMPYASYAQSYAIDVATGTGIHSWSPRGATVAGNDAIVPGTLVLDDKESVPITIALVRQDGGWRVCSSDLGGVLPNPGSGSAPSGGTVTT